MKTLQIPRLNLSEPSIEEVSNKLDQKGAAASVNKVNWNEFSYKPEVSFKMAYDPTALYIKFFVEEAHIRAVETQPNGNVWEDSCCEFFCAFDEVGYYNLETNCIGTQLLGWGRKEMRARADVSIINKIIKHSTLGHTPIEAKTGNFNYELTMMIPSTTFIGHNISFEKGMNFRANFYKCGDKTPRPHFLSWNPIDTPQPDFHQPDFFGKVVCV